MGLEDLTTLDATYPKGNIEPVSALDNYQRETRAKLKAWAAVEHDPATGHHNINTIPQFPTAGRMYYDKITQELRYYAVGPPGNDFWRSVIQPPFNYVFNPEFKMMSDGVGSPPCGWAWSGAPGQGIQQSPFTWAGKYSIALTTPAGGSSPSQLTQNMSTSNPRFLPIDYWRGRTVSFGCYVHCNAANKAYLILTDGVQVVYSRLQSSGGAAWDWCVVTMTVSSGATDLKVWLSCEPDTASSVSYFCEPTLVEGAWCTRPMPQGHPQRSHILYFGSDNGVIQAMTGVRYYGPCGRSNNEFLISTIIPYRYQARDLSVFSYSAPGAGQQVDFRVRYNNAVNSNIIASIAGSNVVAFDNTHTLQGDANSTLSLQSTGSAAPATSIIAATLYLDELPW